MDDNLPKTEVLYQKSIPIDHLNIIDGINLIIRQQKEAATAVKKTAKLIEHAINKIYDRLSSSESGRIVYVGAGTSGRIGVQDGVELFPTFNWPKERLDFLIAGGQQAIINAIENAEDDVAFACKSVKKKMIRYEDVVIGLAASGNTPFTCEVMKQARKKRALTIAISNNPFGNILNFGEVKIVLDTKEEVIAGSTRLKAGTAQKICLNTISSMVMVKMGRVKNGLMSNMVVTNEKLRKRKVVIDSKILRDH